MVLHVTLRDNLDYDMKSNHQAHRGYYDAILRLEDCLF